MDKLVCSECGNGFDRPGSRGPVPTRCPDCKLGRKRKIHAARERERLERRKQDLVKCGHCDTEKIGDDFAPSQRRDGGWCKECFRNTYVERSGGLETRLCAVCDQSFEVTKRSRKRYCSSHCKARASALAQIARNREAKRGRICENCGEEIPAEKQRSARYCSEACRKAHAGPMIRRRCMLKTNYGLTLEQYDALLDSQGGVCALCGGDDPGVKGVWHVDHCHDSLAVRGLLCSPCNTGLGQFKDRPDVLRRAADYVERNQEIKP